MLYAKIVGGVVEQYPVNASDIRRENPDVSFPEGAWPDRLLQDYNCYPVQVIPRPAHDALTQVVEESTPEQINGVWTQKWVVRSATPQEQAAAAEALQNSVVAQTQARLDAFARTRNYDGILSACTYASSTVTKFQVEGQYCVEARDNTWSTLYDILAEVQAGTRPAPESFADIEPDLPPLAWPN